MKRQAHLSLLLAALMMTASPCTAWAQDKSDAPPGSDSDVNPVATPDTTGSQAEGASNATPSIQTSLGKYGDPGGIRAFLDKHGIDYNFTYIGEVLGNPSGGVKQGATYEGRLDVNVDVDTEKLAGWKNGAIHVEGFQIHGRGLSGNNLNDLFTTSNIEAFPDTKLYELWYEHKFADGKFFVRFGQLAADTEFVVSQTATLFVNSTYGFPAITANDLPSGGPAYPLATPGIRLKAQPTDKLTFLAAVFNGDPAGVYRPGVNNLNPQIRDPTGTNFRVEDPPLVIGEAQYAYNQEKGAKGLPGTIKFGYMHHFEDFAATYPTGRTTVELQGNNGVYGVIDQTIYRKPGTDDQGASVFARASYFPGDRNLIDFYVDGGVSYKGFFNARPDDTMGVSAAYGHISGDTSAADIASGAAPLIRDYQAIIEATYQYVILPGWSVQPDFQYVFHPGAHGVAIPGTNVPIHDAAVFGLRTTIHY